MERHRLWSEGEPKGDWLTLAGLEWTLVHRTPCRSGACPALDVRVGLAQVLEEPFPEEVLRGRSAVVAGDGVAAVGALTPAPLPQAGEGPGVRAPGRITRMSDHLFILRHSGDFYTKARKTRLRFQMRLAKNVEDALASHGIPYRLEKTWSRFYLETPDVRATEVLTRVFGLQSVSLVEPRPWAVLDDIVAHGVDVFAESVRGRTFAVRASRRGGVERIPFDSLDVERALGRALLDAGAGRVHLDDPEVTAWVEVEPGKAHFFREKARGWGGLPIGVEGRGAWPWSPAASTPRWRAG